MLGNLMNSVKTKLNKGDGKKNQQKFNEEDKINMNLLIFGYCRRNKKNLATSIMHIILAFGNVVLFRFRMNKFQQSFDINNKSSGKYLVKKRDHQSHETILFGDNLKRKTFESINCNLVFLFKITGGRVNFMIVPDEFNQFYGNISTEAMNKYNYKVLQLFPDRNYKYGQTLRFEIDLIKSLVYINNIETRQNMGTIQFDGIESKKLRIAFAMINPHAKFEIIRQYWKKKRNLCKNKFNKMDLDYNLDDLSSDNDQDIDMKDEVDEAEIMKSKTSINLSKISKDRISSGLNYIGKCGDHIAVFNKGFGDKIDPDDDYDDGDVIICDQCSKFFKHELMILHDCKYAIKYKLSDSNGLNNKKQKESGVAYPDYIDIGKDIIKSKFYRYLKIKVDPCMNI